MTTDAVGPLTLEGSRELAFLDRSGLVESRHAGAAVVVDGRGQVVEALGDTSALIYPRSSLKPLQAVATLRFGAVLDAKQTVLATASHTGTERHVAAVERLLASIGLAEHDLQCPPDWPSDAAALAAARTGGAKRRVTMNCSGKHASFLAACVARDWPTDSYLEPSHPLQAGIRSLVEEFTRETIRHTGVDGCGAPVFALSLAGLARGVGRIAREAADSLAGP
ncbi:MAG TPA: asparaginase [Terrimesophilobacter sp.]|nr:asparaginase [Terrimesophilobacter sp.]